MDISDPGPPKIVGEYLASSVIRSITFRDSLAYVTSWTDFRVLNIVDPHHPKLVSQVESVFADIPNVVVNGRHLFIGDLTREELMVVDVGDPAHPVIYRYIGGIGCDTPPAVKDSVLYLRRYYISPFRGGEGDIALV